MTAWVAIRREMDMSHLPSTELGCGLNFCVYKIFGSYGAMRFFVFQND